MQQPETVIFLTADAFGVLPPVSRLDNDMAMFHFVSGYTSKLAGTERGITEPQTTFSTCFGAPFLPLDPSVYAEMLGERIEKNNSRVFLHQYRLVRRPIRRRQQNKAQIYKGDGRGTIRASLIMLSISLMTYLMYYIPSTCPNVPEEMLNP